MEPYQAAAECTEFSVTVIGTSKGPVALLPTEAEVFDYADDIFEADLDYEAYRARREVCLSVCLDVLHSAGFWLGCACIEALLAWVLFCGRALPPGRAYASCPVLLQLWKHLLS